MLNEGLILEPKKVSHVQFMNDGGVFFGGLPLPRNNTKTPIKTMSLLVHHFRVGKPAGWIWQTTRYKPSCLQDENLRQKSVKVEEASQPMVTGWWLLRQQGGLGISWEIGMCSVKQEKLQLKTKPEWSNFWNLQFFNIQSFWIEQNPEDSIKPHKPFLAFPGEARKKGHFWSAGRLKKFVGVCFRNSCCSMNCTTPVLKISLEIVAKADKFKMMEWIWHSDVQVLVFNLLRLHFNPQVPQRDEIQWLLAVACCWPWGCLCSKKNAMWSLDESGMVCKLRGLNYGFPSCVVWSVCTTKTLNSKPQELIFVGDDVFIGRWNRTQNL